MTSPAGGPLRLGYRAPPSARDREEFRWQLLARASVALWALAVTIPILAAAAALMAFWVELLTTPLAPGP